MSLSLCRVVLMLIEVLSCIIVSLSKTSGGFAAISNFQCNQTVPVTKFLEFSTTAAISV